MSSIFVPKKIKEMSREHVPAFFQSIANVNPRNLEPGQIWSTMESIETPNGRRFETNNPRLIVVLTVDNSLLTVAPLSLDISMATDFDLKVEGQNNPFHFDFMIEVWNETPAQANYLKQYLTKLSKYMIEVLEKLQVAYLLDEDPPEEIMEVLGVSIISEDDPRTIFQLDEIAAMSYLSEASTAGLEEAVLEDIQEPEQYQIRLQLPQWIRRSKWIEPMKPTLGMAADVASREEEGWFVTDRDEDPSIILETRRRKGRTIYFIVRGLSEELTNTEVKILVQINSQQYQTEIVKLQDGIEIILQIGAHFEMNQVEDIRIELQR